MFGPCRSYQAAPIANLHHAELLGVACRHITRPIVKSSEVQAIYMPVMHDFPQDQQIGRHGSVHRLANPGATLRRDGEPAEECLDCHKRYRQGNKNFGRKRQLNLTGC